MRKGYSTLVENCALVASQSALLSLLTNILGIFACSLLHVSIVFVALRPHGNSCHVECQKAQNHLKTTKTPTHSTGSP